MATSKLIQNIKESELTSYCKYKLYDDKANFTKQLIEKKDNYIGLVLLGRKREGSYGAHLAYKKAISCKPKEPLAWLYLATYYQNYYHSVEKVLKTYKIILKLDLNNRTALHVLGKVAIIGFYFNNVKSIQILLDYLGKEPSVKMYVVGKLQLFNVLKENILGNIDDSLIANYLEQEKVEGPLYDSFCIALAYMTLRKYSDLNKALEEITQWPFFSPNAVFRNWLCKYLCEYFIICYTFEFDMLEYKKVLTQGIENLRYPNLLNNIILHEHGNRVDEYNDYESLLNRNDIEGIEAVIVVSCFYVDRKWIYVENLTKNFLLTTKDEYLTNKLRTFLFLSYAEQKKWKLAIKVGTEIPLQSLDPYYKSVLAKCYIEKRKNADHVMQYLVGSKYYQQLQALILIKQDRYEELIKLLDKDTEDPIECLYIAIAYREMFKWDLSRTYFIKAIVLDNSCADTFYHFALYYEDCLSYHHKFAKNCLERAYALNTADMQVIHALHTFYIKYNYRNKIMDLLMGASQYLVREPWIYYAIGLQLHLHHESERSIEYLLKALKYGYKRRHVLKALAGAYYNIKDFEKALKYYIELIDLDPKYEFSYLTYIGLIRAELKQFEEAIITFEKVLEISPDYFNAIIGLAKTWLKLARIQANSKLYHMARYSAEKSIHYSSTAISNGNSYSEPFEEILNEALIFVAELADKYHFVHYHTYVGPGHWVFYM